MPGDAKYRITGIEAQKRKKDRLNIFIDGEFAFGINQEVALQFSLHVDDVLDQSQVDGILFVNPGSPTFLNYRRGLGTVGILTLEAGHADVSIVQLYS